MDYKIPNINEIKLKLFDSLLKSGWNNLKFFINSSDFDKILFQLYSLKEQNKRFTPPIKHVFKAFEDCNYVNLKVVILAEDPYEQLGVANGVAFCCNNMQKIKLNLKNFIKSIYKTVHPDLEIPETVDPSLNYLSQQGVLLLNTSLTCEIDKKVSHYNIWKDFISYFIDSINNKKENVVFILLGKNAHTYEDLIDEDKHYIIKASHPDSIIGKNIEFWDCNDCFNKCNNKLKDLDITTIKWLKL